MAAAPRVTAAPDALPHAHVPQQAAPATPAATPAAAAAAGATPAAAGATPAAAGATPVTTPATAQQQAQQQARARRCLGRRTCLSAAVRALVAGRAHARQLLRTSLSLSPSCPSGTRYPHARCPRLLLLPTTRPRLFVQRPAHMTGFCLNTRDASYAGVTGGAAVRAGRPGGGAAGAGAAGGCAGGRGGAGGQGQRDARPPGARAGALPALLALLCAAICAAAHVITPGVMPWASQR